MSKIALTPNASGTGVFTIASPNSNTDRTLTLPDEAGTVLTSASDIAATSANVIQNDGPTFRAHQTTANTGVASNTYTKVIFNVEDWDSDNCYDTSLYRFTPNVAGYYLMQVNCQIPYTSSAARVMPTLYKNGSLYAEGNAATGLSNQYPSAQCCWLVYLNGSTDYVELYANMDVTSGTPKIGGGGSVRTFFGGYRIIGA